MLLGTAKEEVRARLQELSADFWTADEVLRAINEGVNRFAQEEKWPYLFTIGSATLVAEEDGFTLTPGVSYERHFNLLLFIAATSETVVNEIQQIDITEDDPGTGLFNILIDGVVTTVNMSTTSGESTIQGALDDVFGPDEFLVTGDLFPTPNSVTIEYIGSRAGSDFPPLELVPFVAGDTDFMSVSTLDDGGTVASTDREPRPRQPKRVSPTEGYRLRLRYYTPQSEPLAYYLASQAPSADNEVQSITRTTGTDSGTFKIVFDGHTTTAIPRAATATEVGTALKALSNIGAADVKCFGGPLHTAPITIHFQGALAGIDLPEITLSAAGGGNVGNMSVDTLNDGGGGTGSFVASVQFVPTLSRNCDIEFQYIRDPAEAVDDGDPLDVPDEYAMGVCAYATGHLYLKELTNSQKADEQFALYRKVVDDARRQLRALNSDQGFGWGRNQPEYGAMPEDAWVQMVTPELLGP
jgi:hypothetical protein